MSSRLQGEIFIHIVEDSSHAFGMTKGKTDVISSDSEKSYPQPMDTIKIYPDGRNDIMAICTFYETIKVMNEGMKITLPPAYG